MNRKLQNRQRGVSMVEFAIILPLLLMLLFGITELGRALYQQNSLYKAVESGARYLARSNGTLNEAVNCTVDNNCCEEQGDWDTRKSEATKLIIYGNPAGTGEPLLPYLDDTELTTINIDPEMRPLVKTDGSVVPTCVIIVTAELPFAGMFGDVAVPFTSIEPFHLRAETEERYIGL